MPRPARGKAGAWRPEGDRGPRPTPARDQTVYQAATTKSAAKTRKRLK